MKTSDQFRAGIRKAVKITGISERKASMDAGHNENQINRFVHQGTGIKLDTLEDICIKGFGLSFEAVYRMGDKRRMA